jgi:hypothetical protein
MEELRMGNIYCFINNSDVDWHHVLAITEDGHTLAGHQSTTIGWAKHDIGINSDWQHDKYEEYYPNGYNLIWLDDPLSDETFLKALALAEEMSSYQG